MKILSVLALSAITSMNIQYAIANGGQESVGVLNNQDIYDEPPKDWHHLDKVSDSFFGVSTYKAYEKLLKDKKSQKVVVAVIDSGIDIDHEDLKEKIWVNPKEIAGNGVDDDKNGYVDDIHGWNFIGGKDGSHVSHDSYELTREYARLIDKYAGKSEKDIEKEHKKEFEYFKELESELTENYEKYKTQVVEIKALHHNFVRFETLLKAYLDTEELTEKGILDIETDDPIVGQAKDLLVYGLSQGWTEQDLLDYVEYLENNINYHYNYEFNPRSIVGDNYEDLSERYYGNNDVKGPDPRHGTHVAGIIGAVRNNEIGMDGVADNVEIMVLRAVPDGDERDKDIANSIYYAVDNGAKVINMSFGKSYSPNKDAVDEAIRYAEKKGVLLVHAAGNSSLNTDKESNFPNDKFYGKSKRRASNWIEVGALSWEDSLDQVASFSNYGKKSVDIFAPGVDIFATVPGSEYDRLSGTSMASPVVAGVAGLLFSYYPSLTAAQVKTILLKSAIDIGNLEVILPGDEDAEEVKFKTLSKTGAVVNAYEAILMAEKMTARN